MTGARVLLAILGAGAILAACSDDAVDPLPPGQCFLDRGRFEELAVSVQDTVRFTWCGSPANSLTVRTPAGQTQWAVTCDADVLPFCIDPPVVYGAAVLGTTPGTAPQPLQPGASYQFCLSRGLTGETPVCLSFTR
ncbi:MAG: hypothetical protein ABR599_12300 [Gemmatimonadota bacterium]